MVAAEFPDVRLLRLRENIGVEAFNRGVELCSGDVVLILDDDARPGPRTIEQAMALLADRPDLAAVTLHPRHARTRESEWPFADRPTSRASDTWPVMGCANFVRRADWDRAGGYETRFFLYRNDTDLALKLLSLGRGVHCNARWMVDHDSPATPGGQKSARWHRLATRNWLWLCRRHGRGMTALRAGIMGWAWSHRLAGFSASRQWATLSGVLDGLFAHAPEVPRAVEEQALSTMPRRTFGGGALELLLRLRRGS
jgi:GT2 family glycosyltransferase